MPEPTPALDTRWFVKPDDLIGGWCVMTVDLTPGEASDQFGAPGVHQVGDFLTEEMARHVAELHNAALDADCPTACDGDCDATCHEEHEVPAKRQHLPWQHSEINRLRERVAELERQVAEATATLTELAPLSTATERDDYARRIERALKRLDGETSVLAAGIRMALTIPSAQQEAADELTRLGEEIGD